MYISISQEKASLSDVTSLIAGKADKSTTYYTCDVDNLLTGKASSSIVHEKQNSLIFRVPAQLRPPAQGFPFLGGGNIVPGIAVVPPLN